MTIGGDPVKKVHHMFKEDMYFSIFYFLFLWRDKNILWEHKREERESGLEMEEDIIIQENR